MYKAEENTVITTKPKIQGGHRSVQTFSMKMGNNDKTRTTSSIPTLRNNQSKVAKVGTKHDLYGNKVRESSKQRNREFSKTTKFYRKSCKNHQIC